ncbi:MAG: TraB/GumN family protein [Candidatus Thermoplasmatota archaeon]|nr:TraB/GumN family protein [Candidatus Thermoplasmatota archaeon]
MQVKVSDKIILVGTAHISKDSIKEVKESIEKYKPDVVAVELCKRRYEGITKKDKWENTPVTSLLKSNNAYFMLAQTFLSSIQRKLGKDQGVEPGSEMIAAMDEAKKHNTDIALVDRDISVTLKRAWKKMGIREKFRLVWEFLKAILGYDEEELEELDLKEIMDQDVISAMMEEFGEIAPSVATVLIHERDEYIAKKILDESKKGRVVAVVGAGHIQGIKKHLEKKELNVDLKELEYVPSKRFSVLKTIGYAIPVVFAALIVYIMITGGIGKGLDALKWWFLINGTFSAIGTAIARGHPLSIATAFIAAPITSLNPTIAAGWVAGYVEAKLRTPVIKDFKGLSKVDSLRDFWNNRVIRLLMVVALANVGSMIGTFIALPYLASLGFSV